MSSLEHRPCSSTSLQHAHLSETRDEWAWDRRQQRGRRYLSLAGNILAIIGQQLRDRPCEAYGTDVRLRAVGLRAYLFPELSVACGEIEFADDDPDTLLNPTLAAEVLSPTASLRDREDTRIEYQELPSLRHYMAVYDERIEVELYTRRGKVWLYRCYRAANALVRLPAIGCEVRLDELYDKILFPRGG